MDIPETINIGGVVVRVSYIWMAGIVFLFIAYYLDWHIWLKNILFRKKANPEEPQNPDESKPRTKQESVDYLGRLYWQKKVERDKIDLEMNEINRRWHELKQK